MHSLDLREVNNTKCWLSVLLLFFVSILTVTQGIDALPEAYSSLYGGQEVRSFDGVPAIKRGFPPFSMNSFRLRVPSQRMGVDGQRRLFKRFSYTPLAPANWPVKVIGEDGKVYAIFLPDKLIPGGLGVNGPMYGSPSNSVVQSTNGRRLSKTDENSAAGVEGISGVTNFPDLKYVHLRFG